MELNQLLIVALHFHFNQYLSIYIFLSTSARNEDTFF